MACEDYENKGKEMLKKLILGLIVLASISLCSAQACDFECSYKKHIKSIETKDYATFESTLTKGDKLVLILPNGKYIDDSVEYRNMIKEWFSDEGWTFKTKIIRVEETSEMGYVLLHVKYSEKERAGKPYQAQQYLSLVFKKENNEWLLVHDQNTTIPSSK